MADFFTKAGLIDAGKRAARTFAQALGSAVLLDTTNLLGVDWKFAVSAAAGAALISLLQNISGEAIRAKTAE
ncbi:MULTISPECIES: holin [Nocardia]|uniref:holin n=1 Tax=Nocardia TaxID=1817 RepID=UPI0013008603|nr:MULTISPECIES: holin [Nocardia]